MKRLLRFRPTNKYYRSSPDHPSSDDNSSLEGGAGAGGLDDDDSTHDSIHSIDSNNNNNNNKGGSKHGNHRSCFLKSLGNSFYNHDNNTNTNTNNSSHHHHHSSIVQMLFNMGDVSFGDLEFLNEDMASTSTMSAGGNNNNNMDNSQRSTGGGGGGSSSTSSSSASCPSTNLRDRDIAKLLQIIPHPEKVIPIFTKGIVAKPHRYHLKIYPDCFVASEAVDFLVQALQISRKQAVTLGRLLQRDYHLFEHVAKDHLFKDAYLFFQYMPQELQTKPYPLNYYDRYTTTTKATITAIKATTTTITTNTTRQPQHAVATAVPPPGTLPDETPTIANKSTPTIGIKNDANDRNNNNHSSSSSLQSTITLSQMATILERGVLILNRRYYLKIYPETFVGSEAVDYLVNNQFVSSRQEAVQLGRLLFKEFHLFEHCTKDNKPFEDDYLFYNFLEPSRRIQPLETIQQMTIQQGLESISTRRRQQQQQQRRRRKTKNDENDIDDNDALDILLDAANALENGVTIKDHKWRNKVYPDTFIASEAVDFMINSSLAETRREAVQLGRQMARELHLFEHVTGEHEFSDDYLFFQFTEEDDRAVYYDTSDDGDDDDDDDQNNKISSTSEPSSESMTTTTTKKKSKRLLLSSAPSFLLKSSLSTKDSTKEQLQIIADDMKQNLKVETHRYLAKVYPKSFIASEMIDYSLHRGYVQSRRQGVKLGRALMKELQLFEHVSPLPPWKRLQPQEPSLFKDEYLFFQFSDDIATTTTKSLLNKDSEHAGVNDDEIEQALEPILSSSSMSLQEIAKTFRHGIKLSTHHSHHLPFKSYKETFLGNHAIDFLEQVLLNEPSWLSLNTESSLRKHAMWIGRKLQQEFNLFDKVNSSSNHHGNSNNNDDPNNKNNKDRELLRDTNKSIYKFNKDDEITGGLILVNVTIPPLRELRDIAKALESNIILRDHKYCVMRVFKDAFSGKEAVDFLVKHYATLCPTRSEAVQIGRVLAIKFHLLEHVTMEHNFSDGDYLFRFIKASLRTLWNEEDESIFHEETTDDEDNGDDFGLTSEELWLIKVRVFEDKVKKKVIKKRQLDSCRREFVGASEIPSDVLLGTKYEDPKKALLYANGLFWMSTFRRTDPRFQILKFFTEVSQMGADEIEHTGVVDAEKVRILLKYFYRASVFTVWRPTSLEAIRKMMLGVAVGKGLDIKGKSAKRGKLSAFVPFLQISENKHKRMVRRIPKNGSIRLFFSGDARNDRDVCAEKLEAIAQEMMQTVKEAKSVLNDKNQDDETRRDAKACLSLDMRDPSISYIDEYAPNAFGLEIPSRLFWEAYIVRQDISREIGSVYDTGRPSQPAFQDMNFGALHASPKPEAPRAVVLQNADAGSPMNPYELLMAYEENDTVKPVVSDFDCFLVGTRGVPYKKPLPDDQLSILKWCVRRIKGILDSPKTNESWTNRWLEVLRDATSQGFHPEFPRFGFGDPKSYSIMQHAVGRLSEEGGGAVRHGAECFNFYFPQELDEEFLVISENIANSSVPWKYMNVHELQDFLDRQIDFGYTFPLNLKWVLCDPGWKKLFYRLLSSQKPNVQDSLNAWYPPESGLREAIEAIAHDHPDGFCRHLEDEFKELRQSGTGAMDLAIEELGWKAPSTSELPQAAVVTAN